MCESEGLRYVHDPTNSEPRFRRNRVRHEILPLLDDVAARDVAALLARTADLLRDDDTLLEQLAADLDPTDALALRDVPLPLARRAVRRWLERGGYPPDAATVARVLEVAAGNARGCDVGAGRRGDSARTAARSREQFRSRELAWLPGMEAVHTVSLDA